MLKKLPPPPPLKKMKVTKFREKSTLLKFEPYLSILHFKFMFFRFLFLFFCFFFSRKLVTNIKNLDYINSCNKFDERKLN